jgi:threonyl-tRNA synthetase
MSKEKENKIPKIEKMRHTASHVLAQAVLKLYPNTKLGIGPAIDNGFYYDFEFEEAISDEDLPKIEKEMKKIIKKDLPLKQDHVERDAALERFKALEQEYKLDLLEDIKDDPVSFYVTGDDEFVDLCRGPHVSSTGEVGEIKLLSVAGAYWRGDENNKMLTRIYGTAFKTKEELEKHIKNIELAKERDHRKIGKELDLFTFSELVGKGLPMWTPKGAILREELDNYVWELRRAKGYEKVTIPHITKKDLYEKSGHWEKYSDDFYKVIGPDGEKMALKPMNCPHHTQIFDHVPRSYKEMPQRYAETTMVYRSEQSGELSGLSRVLSITQDDAHVFLRKNQIKEEIESIWDIVEALYGTFDLPLRVRLSFRDKNEPDKYIGNPEVWGQAEAQMKEIAEARGTQFFIAEGEAAFYAPKLDFMAKDTLGREHQVATIQLDLNMPVRFELTCVNEEGEEEQIYMIHAAIMGSIERFLSVLIEHLGGAFPLWLSPEQIRILPIADAHNEYADKVDKKLRELGVRSSVDKRNERLQYKIRDAEVNKIPYTLVVGDKEIETDTVALRVRGMKDQGLYKVNEFVRIVDQEIRDRSLNLLEAAE